MDGVRGAYDLILNDYGPQRLWGSIHVEVDDHLTASQIDSLSRKIQELVYSRYQVILHTVGIYSLNTDETSANLRNEIYQFIKTHKEVLEIHGFYIKPDSKDITMDVIISFDADNRKDLLNTIKSELSAKYPDYQFNITLDSDISD